MWWSLINIMLMDEIEKKIKTKIRKKKNEKKILFKWIVLCEERYK